jgi:hypothetical protein
VTSSSSSSAVLVNPTTKPTKDTPAAVAQGPVKKPLSALTVQASRLPPVRTDPESEFFSTSATNIRVDKEAQQKLEESLLEILNNGDVKRIQTIKGIGAKRAAQVLGE